MRKLFIFALIGFFAQLVDGALGMAFGATSSSLLLTFGVAPAVASASIHISEIFTTAASGTSHLKFKNVDKPLAIRLAIPGSIAAFVGAAFLSSVPGDVIKPYIAVLLLSLGIYIVYKFLFRFQLDLNAQQKPLRKIVLIPLGTIAGFFDAVGGGGWGPVNTPFLLSRKGAVPRKVVGTVDTSEFFITIAASVSFIIFLGFGQISWYWVAAFAIGGVVAAPIAAWLVRVMPAHLLGVLVGGLIIFTNARTVLSTIFPENPTVLLIFYPSFMVLWALGVFYAHKKHKGIKPLAQHDVSYDT